MNAKALLAALLSAAVGVVVLVLYLRKYEVEVRGGEPIRVFYATQDLPLGAELTEQMLRVQAIPSDYVESRHVREEERGSIVGLRVRVEVKANEAILWSDLATTTSDRRDLSSLISPGLRALSMRTKNAPAFTALIRPGDRVDVYLTTATAGGQAVTLPLLQNLLVLAIGRDTGGDDSTGEATSSGGSEGPQITVSVSPAQAQLLAFCQANGSLTAAIRNPDDQEVREQQGAITWDTLINPVERQEIQRREPGRPRAQPQTTPENQIPVEIEANLQGRIQ